MRTKTIPRGRGKNRATTMDGLTDALAKILATVRPVEAIEVSLSEAIGLVLAEPAIADVDLPPFDRASIAGYAVSSRDVASGVLLRISAPWSDDGHGIDRNEAARVEPGEAMPLGADAVLRVDEVRAELGGRVVEALCAIKPGQSVVRRGSILRSGSILAETGERVRPSMVPLLASQGCIYPLCHRRVRVAILAVGDHLVGPADAPVLHHERNASNLAVGAIVLADGAMPHDLGSVAESEFEAALDRGLNAPLVLILGRLSGGLCRTLARVGVEPVVSGIALETSGGFDLGHGVVRDEDGRVVSHVVHLPLDPSAAVVAASLIVRPLIARLQGSDSDRPTLPVVWDAPQPATDVRTRAIPASLMIAPDGRLRALPVASPDLPDLALADGLALFPPSAGPWQGGEVIGFVSFEPWPGRPGT